MTEAILLLVIVAQFVLLGFIEWNNRKERKGLTNALIAKNNQELVNLELAEKTKIDVPQVESLPDIIPSDALTDEEYEDMILGKGGLDG